MSPDHIATTNFYGGTKFAEGKMVRFVNRTVAKFDETEKEQLKKVIRAVSAEAALPYQAIDEANLQAVIEEGRALAADEIACTDCHQFRTPDPDATAPDLTGYGSKEWLTAFIKNPAHERFYGNKNDRMPAFGENERLDDQSISLIVDWLRRDWPHAQETQ